MTMLESKIRLLLLQLIISLAISFWGIILPPTEVDAQKYELVWSDEFNADELDRDTWTLWEGTAYNNEAQYYTPRDTNIYLEDGHLHIRALKEKYKLQPYTSARMKSQYNGDWKYGRIEARIKLPYGQGIWPAFWMMPTDAKYGGWPHSGEIDIMEMVGHEPDVVHGTVHYSRVGTHQSYGSDYELEEGIFHDDFHIFAIEKKRDRIDWFVDDSLYHTMTRDSINANPFPFNERYYVILNLAVGGNWPGYPDHTTKFPQLLVVDYVRVYQDSNIMPAGRLEISGNPSSIPAGESVELNVTTSDEDGEVTSVIFYVNDEIVDTVTSHDNGTYSLSWTPPVETCYELKALVKDNDNGSSWTETLELEVGHGCSQAPYSGTNFRLPASIPAYQFDYGGPEVAYHDLDPYKNSFAPETGTLRPYDGVDSRHLAKADTQVVDRVMPGEWMEYSLYVASTDTFRIVTKIIKKDHRNRLELALNGENLVNFYRYPSSGEDNPFSSLVSMPKIIERGLYKLRVTANGGEMGILGYDFIRDANYTGIEAQATAQIPEETGLIDAYPNPFNATTQIRFQLARPQQVALAIYNLQGQKLATVLNGKMKAGLHTLPFHGNNLSSGMYLIQLSSQQGVSHRTITLVK